MAVASCAQTRNNYLCINCICTRMHNVPKFLSPSLAPGEVTASSHRRIAERVCRICAIVHVPLRVCKQNAYLHRRRDVCGRATDPHLRATRRYLRGGAYVPRVLRWRIFCSDRAFPTALCSLNEPRAAHHRASTVAKRGSAIFLSAGYSLLSPIKNWISFIFLS